jgi:hypothetical protein
MRWTIAQMAGGLTFVDWRNSPRRARLPKVLSTGLTDLVAGQFTVEGLIASTLLGRPKDSVLFHTGE